MQSCEVCRCPFSESAEWFKREREREREQFFPVRFRLTTFGRPHCRPKGSTLNSPRQVHCRANMEHIRQPRPDSGPVFQVKALNTLNVFSLRSEEVGGNAVLFVLSGGAVCATQVLAGSNVILALSLLVPCGRPLTLWTPESRESTDRNSSQVAAM